MAKRGAGKRHLLEKRLVTYSVAAGAALAVAGPADANVIYSGAKNITVDTVNPLVNVDINGDAVNDFKFSYYLTSWISSSLFNESKGIWIAGAQTGNSAIGGNAHVVSFFTFAPYRLPQGDDVSSGMAGTWTSSYGVLNGIKYIGGFPNGTANVSGASQIALGAGITVPMGSFTGNRGFIGVRFQISGNTHYGWIEYEGSTGIVTGSSDEGSRQLKNGLPFVQGTIYGWAYEDVPERRIKAGDKGQPAQPVPTLNEWGMIFLMGLILLEGTRRLRNRGKEA